LIKQVWEEGKIPADWRTGLIFPIQKRVSEDKCENTFTNTQIIVLYNGVARYAEIVTGNYQNGFRSGRGITDNIFLIRLFIEKAYEYVGRVA